MGLSSRLSIISHAAASQELQNEFNSLLASDDTFGLLASIENESLVPVATLPSTSSSFGENLASLQPHIKTDVALYIILRRYESAPRFLAITYVPDAARVRQKMLFASTRLTLVRELGSEHFRETIFVTVPEELSEKGFQKHDAHTKLDAPLTEEEQALGEVKRAEQEAGSGTGVKAIHLSKSFSMPIGEDAVAAMKEVGQDGGRAVVMLVSYFGQSKLIYPMPDTNSLAENQPGDRGGGAGSRVTDAKLNRGVDPGHLADRAAVHLLPIHPHPRRRRAEPRALPVHLPRDAGKQGHQVQDDVPADEARGARGCRARGRAQAGEEV